MQCSSFLHFCLCWQFVEGTNTFQYDINWNYDNFEIFYKNKVWLKYNSSGHWYDTWLSWFCYGMVLQICKLNSKYLARGWTWRIHYSKMINVCSLQENDKIVTLHIFINFLLFKSVNGLEMEFMDSPYWNT